MLSSSPSFSLRVRIYEEKTDEGGGDVRSFDSTAFLPIRQTFDSFTWEPRNSSWWLSSSSSPLLSFFLFLSFPALCAISWSMFRYQVHVSWPSMPLDMSSVESRFCVFSNAIGQLHLITHYPSSVNSTIAANVLRAPCRFTARIARADIFFLSRDALYSVWQRRA